MSTVYEASHTPIIKAHFDRFVLKGEDFQVALPALDLPLTYTECHVNLKIGLFGIFDGHGGKAAAQYASKQLPERLIDELQKLIMSQDDSSDSLQPYLSLAEDVPRERAVNWLLHDRAVQHVPAALRSVFVSINDDFVREHEKSGTTATVAVVIGRELVVATVGDSLAYLDTGEAIVQVSANHRIDTNQSERERILAGGGEVMPAAYEGEAVGPDRVWPGGLAFSRSIGDACGGALVTAEPEVTQIHVGCQGARLILASDGAWDAITGHAAARRVRSMPATKAAPNLKVYCKNQRARDDITVVIADILTDADSKIPDALSPSSRGSPRSLLHVDSGTASMISGMTHHESPFRSTWAPLVATPKHNYTAWLEFSMAQRSATLELVARARDVDLCGHAGCGEIADSAAPCSGDPGETPPCSELYEELIDLRLDMHDVEQLDDGNDDDWETVPTRRKAADAGSSKGDEDDASQDHGWSNVPSQRSSRRGSAHGRSTTADRTRRGGRQRGARGRDREGAHEAYSKQPDVGESTMMDPTGSERHLNDMAMTDPSQSDPPARGARRGRYKGHTRGRGRAFQGRGYTPGSNVEDDAGEQHTEADTPRTCGRRRVGRARFDGNPISDPLSCNDGDNHTSISADATMASGDPTHADRSRHAPRHAHGRARRGPHRSGRFAQNHTELEHSGVVANSCLPPAQPGCDTGGTAPDIRHVSFVPQGRGGRGRNTNRRGRGTRTGYQIDGASGPQEHGRYNGFAHRARESNAPATVECSV